MRREWTERTEDYKDYSDYGESASGLSVDKKSLTDKEPIWHETGASTFFENGESMTQYFWRSDFRTHQPEDFLFDLMQNVRF